MKIKNLLHSALLLSTAIIIGFSASCANVTSILKPVTTNPAAEAPSPAVTVKNPTAKPVLDEAGQPRKNLFISPFPPHNPIDTTGFSSGDIVGDPSTATMSQKTGKPILSTSKGFRIP